MSLAEMEAYERERRLRRERVRRVLFWIPLSVAVLLMVVGGLSVWSAASGHDADRAAVSDLVEERESEAEELEAEFRAAWAESLERVTPVRVERLEADGEAMRTLLNDALETGGNVPSGAAVDDETLDPLRDLFVEGVPALEEGARVEAGTFEPVVVGTVGFSYSYFGHVEVFDSANVAEEGEEDEPASAVAALSVTWTTDHSGAITELDAHWLDETPERF